MGWCSNTQWEQSDGPFGTTWGWPQDTRWMPIQTRASQGWLCTTHQMPVQTRGLHQTVESPPQKCPCHFGGLSTCRALRLLCPPQPDHGAARASSRMAGTVCSVMWGAGHLDILMKNHADITWHFFTYTWVMIRWATMDQPRSASKSSTPERNDRASESPPHHSGTRSGCPKAAGCFHGQECTQMAPLATLHSRKTIKKEVFPWFELSLEWPPDMPIWMDLR